MRVLVIEDDPGIRGMLAATLISAGHVAAEAGSLREGLWRADEDHPDAVLLDLRLPDNDGPDGVARLAETGLAVVVLTGSDDDDVLRDCVRAGALDALAKPARTADILRALVRAVAVAERRPLPQVVGWAVRDAMLAWAGGT